MTPEEEPTPDFDAALIEELNEQTIKSQFFTPDNVYIELGLFKDFELGCVYADKIFIQKDKVGFEEIQVKLLPGLPDYQNRTYETVSPHFDSIGYSDEIIDTLLNNPANHNAIFMLSPATQFLKLLIRHTYRNQNNSRPANKYIKRPIGNQNYVVDAISVTYRINTYPLQVSPRILEDAAEELGESFGVNIVFMCKDPAEFDEADWNDWLAKTDCFYLHSMGRFTRSKMCIEKQGNMLFNGTYFFARKRFERYVLQERLVEDFEFEIQRGTALMDIFCDFQWLQNSDLRLTGEEDDVPMNED